MGLTEIEAPWPINVPPQLPVYQFQVAPVPRVPLTDIVLVCPTQIVAGDAPALVTVDIELTTTWKEMQAVVLQVPTALT